MDNNILLSVRELGVVRDHHTLLDHVSFDVKQQEVLAVIGPSGAGKSVLLKTLLGILEPTRGTIMWREGVRIGYLPQRFHVDAYLPMTVGEFLNLKPHARSIHETLKLLSLEREWLHKHLAHLSGGELQRVLLLWALSDNPDILLFDEPTENVDVVGSESIYKLLHHLQDAMGIAIIIVSHDLHVVFRYANQVLCINKNMICYGAPEETLTTKKLGELYGDHAFFHHHHEHLAPHHD